MTITNVINESVYRVHPFYDLYAADKDGNIVHIFKKHPFRGSESPKGYMYFSARKHGCRKRKVFIHRFVWETFNGLIPEGKFIDHINDVRNDNRLQNLQLVTTQQNNNKAAKNIDFSQLRKNRKCVKAVNIETEKVSYFSSIYCTQQHLGIDSSTIRAICEKLYCYKTSLSKKDGCRYKFEYAKEEDLPADHYKSANIKPRRVSDEDKKKRKQEWNKKEYQCWKCKKTLKNGSKYLHNKTCQTKYDSKWQEMCMKHKLN